MLWRNLTIGFFYLTIEVILNSNLNYIKAIVKENILSASKGVSKQ